MKKQAIPQCEECLDTGSPVKECNGQWLCYGCAGGCEKCGEPTNNAEPICLQCHMEEQEYWRTVNEELNQFNPKTL